MKNVMKHILVLTLVVSYAFEKVQAQSNSAIVLSVKERIQNHPIWRELKQDSVERFFKVYNKGVDVEVSKALLVKYEDVFGSTSSSGIMGAALAAIGHFVVYQQGVRSNDSGDKRIGNILTGIGLSVPLGTYALTRNSAVSGYKEFAGKVKIWLENYKIHNRYTTESSVKDFLEDYLLVLGSVTKSGQKADKMVTYLEQNEDLSDSAREYLEGKIDNRVDDIVEEVLLFPYNLFHMEETMTIQEKKDVAQEVRGNIANIKRKNNEIAKAEEELKELNQKLEELKKQD